MPTVEPSDPIRSREQIPLYSSGDRYPFLKKAETTRTTSFSLLHSTMTATRVATTHAMNLIKLSLSLFRRGFNSSKWYISLSLSLFAFLFPVDRTRFVLVAKKMCKFFSFIIFFSMTDFGPLSSLAAEVRG